MKRKILLFACVLGSAVVSRGQVKIGHDAQAPAQSGALLELSNNSGGGAAGWKTLLLPYVDFSNTTSFANSSVWGIAGSAAEGSMVYNTGARSSDGFSGKGVYVWSNGAWTAIHSAASSGCSDPGQTAGSKGCVRFTYRGQEVTYVTVRGKDDKIWLQQNLGSMQVAVSGTDAAAFGDYFQWGRWDDGHQSAFSALSSGLPAPNNPSGLGMGTASYFSSSNPWWWTDGGPASTWSGTVPSANNGKDPCTALGAGWHLPSQLEWQNLFLAEGITDTTTLINSNLRLVKAGYRLMDGTFSGKNTYANYWTSTPSTPAPPTGMGYAINVYRDQYGSGVSLNNMYPRALAKPLRCVKD